MLASLPGARPCHRSCAKTFPFVSSRAYSDSEARWKRTPCGHCCIVAGKVLPGAVKNANCCAGGMARGSTAGEHLNNSNRLSQECYRYRRADTKYTNHHHWLESQRHRSSPFHLDSHVVCKQGLLVARFRFLVVRDSFWLLFGDPFE